MRRSASTRSRRRSGSSPLQELERDWGLTKSHPYFSPGFFTIGANVFHADTGVPYPAYLPNRASIELLIWYPPQEPAADVVAGDRALSPRGLPTRPWLSEHPPTFEWLKNWPPMLIEWGARADADDGAGHEAVTGRAVPQPDPAHPVNFGAASDGSFYEAAGIPAVVYGPGDLKIAHCRDEYVVLDEVGSPRRHWGRGSGMVWPCLRRWNGSGRRSTRAVTRRSSCCTSWSHLIGEPELPRDLARGAHRRRDADQRDPRRALPQAGLETHWVAEDPERQNLVGVRAGGGGGRSRCSLNGHIDTVPPAEADRWLCGSPWTAEIRDGRLYGLGSTDMKASAVSMWLAAQARTPGRGSRAISSSIRWSGRRPRSTSSARSPASGPGSVPTPQS